MYPARNLATSSAESAGTGNRIPSRRYRSTCSREREGIMRIIDLLKRSIFCLVVLALTGLALTPPAIAAEDAGFPPPTGDPSVVPPGARVERLWDGGCILTEGVAAGHDGMVYFSDITFSKFCKDPSGKYIQAGNIWRYNPRTGEFSIYRSPSGMS